MNVRLLPSARADIERAQDWYEAQRAGLGAQFVHRVDQAIDKIAPHPEAYQQVVQDVRRAAVRASPGQLWFRIEPNSSIVIACLYKRRETKLAIKRALKRLEP